MADIQQIVAFTWTSTSDDAGTDGDVYLGIAGREFYLDTPEDDNEPKYGIAAVLGPAATVSEPAMNDPRSPYQLETGFLDRFPTYLRLAGDDHWKLHYAMIWVYSGADVASKQISHVYSTPFAGGGSWTNGMWLGPTAGQVLHLHLEYLRSLEDRLRKAGLLDFVTKSLPQPWPAKRKSPAKKSAPKRRRK